MKPINYKGYTIEYLIEEWVNDFTVWFEDKIFMSSKSLADCKAYIDLVTYVDCDG